VFFWDDGLRLARADLAVDFSRRQPRAFISHAHADHMARHEYALCTPATAALYHCRLGLRPTLELPYRRPVDWGNLRLTTFPAGHCLGSAMLLAEDGEQSLLYTGDFKLSPSATCEPAELPHADILIIESTFGNPAYRLPPRNEVVEELIDRVRGVVAAEGVAVIEAYALGKAQEVTRLLTAAGIPVLQHPAIVPISRVYEACGVDLGEYGCWTGGAEAGNALVVTPRTRRLECAGEVRFAVTGWAKDASAKYRLRVDHAIALSDHADYEQLFEAVRSVAPRKVYCTHGPESFVDRLCEAGYDARPLGRPFQRRLF